MVSCQHMVDIGIVKVVECCLVSVLTTIEHSTIAGGAERSQHGAMLNDIHLCNHAQFNSNKDMNRQVCYKGCKALVAVLQCVHFQPLALQIFAGHHQVFSNQQRCRNVSTTKAVD